MPRDLFGDVTDPHPSLGSRKWYTVPLSLAAHALILLALVVAPLVATGALPLPASRIVFVPAVAPELPPAPAVRSVESAVSPPGAAAPMDAPDTIAPEPAVAWFDLGVEGGIGVEALGVRAGADVLAPPPPLPPPPPARTVRSGGEIQPPRKIVDVAPVYPPLAQSVGIEGLVVIEATIAVDGRVQDARVLRSAPLLDAAALAAVRQWIYTPTRLNGEPVSVIMTVTVNFQLH